MGDKIRHIAYPGNSVVMHGEEVHFVRAPSAKKLESLARKGMKKLFISKSAHERMSKKAKRLLEERGIEVRIASERGRPLKSGLEKISRIIGMKNDYQSYRQIEKELGVSKSTAHYLVKYAKRGKIRDKDKTIGF